VANYEREDNRVSRDAFGKEDPGEVSVADGFKFINPFTMPKEQVSIKGCAVSAVVICDRLGFNATDSTQLIEIVDKDQEQIMDENDIEVLCWATDHCLLKGKGKRRDCPRHFNKAMKKAMVLIPTSALKEEEVSDQLMRMGGYYIGVSKYYGKHVFVVDVGAKEDIIVIDVWAFLHNADLLDHMEIPSVFVDELIAIAKLTPSNDELRRAIVGEIQTRETQPIVLVNFAAFNRYTMVKSKYPAGFNRKIIKEIKEAKVYHQGKYYVSRSGDAIVTADTWAVSRFLAAYAGIFGDGVKENSDFFTKYDLGYRTVGSQFESLGSNTARRVLSQFDAKEDNIKFFERLAHPVAALKLKALSDDVHQAEGK